MNENQCIRSASKYEPDAGLVLGKFSKSSVSKTVVCCLAEAAIETERIAKNNSRTFFIDILFTLLLDILIFIT